MTTPCDGKPITLTWKQLHAAQFAFDSPFQFYLDDGSVFLAEKVLRLIPKKRLVAMGTWSGKKVVAKLFFAEQQSKRYMEKELAGVRLLQEHHVPTPALLHTGKSQDGRTCVVMFEYIEGAVSLDDIWRNKKNMEEITAVLKSIVVELATQHVFGILQQDLHLKNFLLKGKKIYTLDGADVEYGEPLLSKKMSLNHLALFLSQLGVGVEVEQEKLFNFYAKSRGWLIKEEDKRELFFSIKRWNEIRWKKFEEKIFRDSTDFAVRKKNWMQVMYDRQYASSAFMAFLDDPEMAFQHPSMVMLKNGRSSTVIKITLDQRDYVVKRYNLKNSWHRLRRCLRPTRAQTSWRLAQKLKLFCLSTAKPAAYIEKNILGFRGQSYYVTEYVNGEQASAFFFRYHRDEEKMSAMVKRIVRLLKNVAKLEITHGDLKMSNILIDENEQPVLIDLDGAAEHLSLSGLHRAWKKEVDRLLDNFHAFPKIKEKFKKDFA